MLVRILNDLEVNAVSVERAREYSEIPQEVRGYQMLSELYF